MLKAYIFGNMYIILWMHNNNKPSKNHKSDLCQLPGDNPSYLTYIFGNKL